VLNTGICNIVRQPGGNLDNRKRKPSSQETQPKAPHGGFFPSPGSGRNRRSILANALGSVSVQIKSEVFFIQFADGKTVCPGSAMCRRFRCANCENPPPSQMAEKPGSCKGRTETIGSAYEQNRRHFYPHDYLGTILWSGARHQ